MRGETIAMGAKTESKPSYTASCATVRRLAMLRSVLAGATDPSTRTMVTRLITEWWPGLRCEQIHKEEARRN